MTTATNTVLGEIKLAGDLAGNNNGLAPELTATAVTPGSYTVPVLTIDAKGRVTAASSASSATITALIPDATSSVKGIASFSGTDFTVTAGAVALNTASLIASLPVATGSTLGVVQAGTNITNTGGTLSVPNASTSVKGVASFSSDFTVTAGAVALNYAGLTPNLTVATGSVFGVVKSGTNITNTAGVFSIADATTAVKGVASFNSADFSVSSGAVSLAANVARTDAQNAWTKAQSYTVQALAYAATITPDFSLSNVFSLTATGNFTLANPTNVVAGTTYLIIITQDATGSRLITWGANFKFGAGAIQTLSTGANKRDIISVVALNSSTLLVTTQLGF